MQEKTPFTPPQKPQPETVDLPVDATGNTYLHDLCAKKAPVALIREAVTSLGSSLTALNNKNLPPLGIAILEGETETVRTLIELGSPLSFPVGKDVSFNAALLAVSAGREEILEAVLQTGGGVNINEPGVGPDGVKSEWLCLHLAVKNYREKMTGLLLGAGAFPEAESGTACQTPLQLAAQLGFVAIMDILLENGARLERENSVNGFTALHYAVLHDKQGAVEALLDRGADVNAPVLDGMTPLMLAASTGNAQLVSLLLRRNADIDARRENGETALMYAAKKGSLAVVKALLGANADPTLTDSFNKSAIQYASESQQHLVMTALRDRELEVRQERFEKAYTRYRP